MTREQAFKDINETQEYYVNELIEALNDKNRDCFKEQNFTSDTGTGKTKMMAMLCNKMPDKYFVITTLSKGQLQHQIRKNLANDIKQDNFVVYGLCDYTTNTKLQANDILQKLPHDKQIVWLRDEGHIHTNKWQELFNSAIKDKCWKIVNISATNKEEGIRCNFSHTMMLRTVNQQEGTPEEALDKLLEVKKQHKKVNNYNPCAIMRCLDKESTDRVINGCVKRKLKYINITEEDFDMSDLCEDNNEYDVIINKFKIVEGIDLRRAHVLYMTNEPTNSGTTIQIIGRCRRNALLYRNDVDIFKDIELLKNTRQCYVYFNVQNMKVDADENGNLCMAFCNKISCEKLKVGSTIHVEKGVMDNGLCVIELEGETGNYTIQKDDETGFNVVKPENNFYEMQYKKYENYVYIKKSITRRSFVSGYYYYKYNIKDIRQNLTLQCDYRFNYATGEQCINKEYYDLFEHLPDVNFTLSPEQVNSFIMYVDSIRNFSIISQKQNKKSITLLYKDITIKNGYSIFDYEVISKLNNINNQDELNEKLFELFYDKETEQLKRVKNEDELQLFINKRNKRGLNIDSSLLPWSMKPSEEFCIMQHNVKKINPTLVSTISNYNYIPSSSNLILKDDVDEIDKYYEYNKIINDRESSIIGCDLMKPIKTNNEVIWIEDRAVTSKVKKYSKLNSFIQKQYREQIASVKPYLYNGKNKFKFDTRCNSCLGYCAEYYGKYLVYGDLFLKKFIENAKKESKVDYVNDFIIVRACMLMYKDMMGTAYGAYTAKLIRTISVQQLIQSKYKEFVDKVIELGTNIANFVKKEFNIIKPLEIGDKLYDPNLSINHIAGLADFITKDKIIDVKCTSSITMDYVKQVLAYHYLSTKRDDLDIKEVIVFDAVNNKSVKIKI